MIERDFPLIIKAHFVFSRLQGIALFSCFTEPILDLHRSINYVFVDVNVCQVLASLTFFIDVLRLKKGQWSTTFHMRWENKGLYFSRIE